MWQGNPCLLWNYRRRGLEDVGEEGDFVDGKKKMLIADDAKINRVILRQLFQEKYDIIEAANGREVVSRLQGADVKIVLLDLVMPEMDGFEVLAYLRSHDEYADLPVVAVTTRDDGDAGARALEMGARDFVTKPFHPLIVQRRVQNVLAEVENQWRQALQLAKDHQIHEMHRFIEEDSLTGVYNRETFYRKAAELMQENEGTDYEVIYFNISAFRVINDLFRVETGNLILKTAAYYLRAAAGASGVCGRMEADHFALCQPVRAIPMDTLMQGLDSTVQSLGISHNVLFYAGVYPVENIYLPVDQMLDRARLALAHIRGDDAKRYCVYDHSMRDQLLKEQMILRDMEFALQERQFEVYYQPVYRQQTGRIVGAEALVRWRHPSEGLISPGDFVPLFEHNGFIVRLDRFVWDQVAQFLAEMKEEIDAPLAVSVNVSRLNFYNQSLQPYLRGLVEQHGLEPWMLKLEVTESAYMENPQQIVDVTQAFRAEGFHVLIDDFGRGVSSLEMLKQFPVDFLKIDSGFLRSAGREERARTILESLVSMVKKLGMGIVVEGVETREQLAYLASIGCESIQGYVYAKPMPAEEFRRLLQREGMEHVEKTDGKGVL